MEVFCIREKNIDTEIDIQIPAKEIPDHHEQEEMNVLAFE
jgi:hypothetical protein